MDGSGGELEIDKSVGEVKVKVGEMAGHGEKWMNLMRLEVVGSL